MQFHRAHDLQSLDYTLTDTFAVIEGRYSRSGCQKKRQCLAPINQGLILALDQHATAHGGVLCTRGTHWHRISRFSHAPPHGQVHITLIPGESAMKRRIRPHTFEIGSQVLLQQRANDALQYSHFDTGTLKGTRGNEAEGLETAEKGGCVSRHFSKTLTNTFSASSNQSLFNFVALNMFPQSRGPYIPCRLA